MHDLSSFHIIVKTRSSWTCLCIPVPWADIRMCLLVCMSTYIYTHTHTHTYIHNHAPRKRYTHTYISTHCTCVIIIMHRPHIYGRKWEHTFKFKFVLHMVMQSECGNRDVCQNVVTHQLNDSIQGCPLPFLELGPLGPVAQKSDFAVFACEKK